VDAIGNITVVNSKPVQDIIITTIVITEK
jgi:hypothetical protein